MPSLVETINHPPKPVPQRAPVSRYDVCCEGSRHVPFQTTDPGPTATTILAQPGEQHAVTCPSATAPVAVPTHPGGPHAFTCPTAAAPVAASTHPGGPRAVTCPTAAASVAVPTHPGGPYADSCPTAASSVAVPAHPGGPYAVSCPTAAASVAVPAHPGGPYADSCPTAAASVAVPAHPGGPYADSCPTAAASVAHPGQPYADSHPTAATSATVPADPGGSYAAEHHADACPTTALSVSGPDHPTEPHTDARPTAAANVHAPARSGGLRVDAPPFIPASRNAPAHPVELRANACPTADASISGPSHTTEQHAAASVTAPAHPAEQIADACSPGATTAHTHPTESPGAACPYQQVDANPSFAPVYLRDLYNTVQRTGCYNFMAARKPVPSGLNIASWRRYLADYTDHNLVDMLEFGWPIHFDRSQPLTPVHMNHHTANAYPEHVDHYIRTELGHGALLGPFAGPPVINLHTSPLMTREKKDSPHRRVIVDLSFPPGFSINDGIPTTHYLDGPLSIHLPTVHTMEKRILDLGQGAFLYKTDLARGYRQLRVDPLDWGLLAFSHQGLYYIDICPPFGLRTAALMMVRTTTAITHIHMIKGFVSIAYIDDFGGAEKKLGEAELALHTLQGIFEELGVQEAERKVCLPSQVMTWLGIEFNTKEMTMSLPEKKLREVAECLAEWQGKKRANLKEIQSVFGLLQFVTSVAPTARLFTNRILEAMRDLGPDHYTTLSWGFKRDLKFFQDLIPHFKGIKVMDKSDIPAQHSLELDACLTGCGAICHPEFYGRMFPESVKSQNHTIAHLELLNIVVAIKVWGEAWAGHRVRITCDNMNSVLALQSGRTRDRFMQHCAREIFYYCARFDIEILPSHAPGSQMHRADALSREHLGLRYARVVQEDPELQRATRIDPDDRLFCLMTDL